MQQEFAPALFSTRVQNGPRTFFVDVKSAKNNSTTKNTPTEVLLYRKAVGAGFASLFQDMCSSAGIRCLTADGFVKFSAEQVNEKKPEINHSWAVVQLGQSPEAWYYADPCWGSGYTDPEFKSFTKSFNPDYFFADLTIFNWQHYPDNTAWQLGPGPKNKSDFLNINRKRAIFGLYHDL